MYAFREIEINIAQQPDIMRADELGNHVVGFIDDEVTVGWLAHCMPKIG
jgi:hypothetical protein